MGCSDLNGYREIQNESCRGAASYGPCVGGRATTRYYMHMARAAPCEVLVHLVNVERVLVQGELTLFAWLPFRLRHVNGELRGYSYFLQRVNTRSARVWR